MLSIRPASAKDAPLLIRMILELAEFEKLADEVTVTEEDLLRDGFGAHPKFRALIAEWHNEAAGYAFFYKIYSTFQGRQGMFLEDLYVTKNFRGKNVGKSLIAAVAKIAIEEDCFGLRWEVLDWNQPAIGFYKNLGAEFLDDWKNMLLMSDDLRALAESSR